MSNEATVEATVEAAVDWSSFEALSPEGRRAVVERTVSRLALLHSSEIVHLKLLAQLERSAGVRSGFMFGVLACIVAGYLAALTGAALAMTR